MEAYLDNSATTKVFDEVKDIMVETMLKDYGNPPLCIFEELKRRSMLKKQEKI